MLGCVLQVISRLKEGLSSKGIQAKVIYSGGADVDILAAGASKGDGLEFLLSQVCAREIISVRNRKHSQCHVQAAPVAASTS